MLLVSLAGTAIGSLVTGLAGGLAVLLVGRIIDGASGASVSVAQAAAADLATPADRHRLFGLLGAAFGVGFVAGPALGSLAALGGPRLPFFLAAVIAAVNTVVAARRLPETHRAGAAAGPPRPGPIAALAGGAGLAPLLAVGFCALVAFSGFEATFALFGERRLGFGIASSAAVFTVVGAAIVVVQGGLVHRVVARVGRAADAAGRAGRQRRRAGPPGAGPLVGAGGAGAGRPDRRAGSGPDDHGDDAWPAGPGPSGGAGCSVPSSRSTAWPGWPAPPSAAPCSVRRPRGLPYVLGAVLSGLAAVLLLAASRRRGAADVVTMR